MSRAADYRLKQAKEVTLPSGATFLLRRVPIQTWLKSDKLPDFLRTLLLEAQQSQGSEEVLGALKTKALERLGTLTEPEQIALLKFQADAVSYAMVSPRLVIPQPGEPDPDPETLGRR